MNERKYIKKESKEKIRKEKKGKETRWEEKKRKRKEERKKVPLPQSPSAVTNTLHNCSSVTKPGRLGQPSPPSTFESHQFQGELRFGCEGQKNKEKK